MTKVNTLDNTMDDTLFDALVLGCGPAGLALAAALCQAGLRVAGLAPNDPETPWTNTYGIWYDDLDRLGLAGLLGHCWTNCVVYAAGQAIPLQRAYGLFDNQRLQVHLLEQCTRNTMHWQRGTAARIEHFAGYSRVTTREGQALSGAVVIDASGHKPVFLQRPATTQLAFQAAYGIVGTFSAPPVQPQQLVLMDYRADYLPPEERRGPPTFLYAMDMGNDVYFVEETSLADRPPVSLKILEQRLYRRLAFHGIQIRDIHHVERCLFPMNVPLPNLDQPLVGFGGAAGMVHPASGYQVGASLRHAPAVARAIARALAMDNPSPARTAQAAWQALWPAERVRNRNLYLFGLENLMRFDDQGINDFFATFFHLPYPQWTGYLSDTLATTELLQTMLTLFRRAPNGVRGSLVGSVGSQGGWLWRALMGY